MKTHGLTTRHGDDWVGRRIVKTSKFSAIEILRILAEVEGGTSVHKVCVAYGISLSTFYEWRKRYQGVPIEALANMRALEVEVHGLRRQVALLEKDRAVLQAAMGLLDLRPAAKRAMVDRLVGRFDVGLSRICKLIGISRSLYQYRAGKDAARGEPIGLFHHVNGSEPETQPEGIIVPSEYSDFELH